MSEERKAAEGPAVRAADLRLTLSIGQQLPGNWSLSAMQPSVLDLAPVPRATVVTFPKERIFFGPVAQRLEQGTHNPLVVCSNHTGPISLWLGTPGLSLGGTNAFGDAVLQDVFAFASVPV